MQEIYIDKINAVLANKKSIEKEFNVKLKNRNHLVFVEGIADKEYLVLEILEALDLGFSLERAFLLKNENIILYKISIKEITKRHDLERVRARIIGTHGKTLKTLQTLTDCYIALKENNVGIIGETEKIKEAIQSVVSLIHGAKQGNVYARVERRKKSKKQRNNI